jgi:DNA topoisomerase VI subunit B
MASAQKISSATVAEYFSKNLQQVGFSSATKAVLTTIKEAVDNALDACEEEGTLPEIWVEVEKVGVGSSKNSDSIRVTVEDNGPGLSLEDIPKVFGEYLASSKFGKGRCSRGQQGIGISACTTWAQLTSASGASVITKTSSMRQAVQCMVEVDIKANKGVLKNKESIDWTERGPDGKEPKKDGTPKKNGVKVSFVIDGRVQWGGEGGLLAYLNGTALVNPHMTMHYKLPAQGDETAEWVHVERVSDVVPEIPKATEPHPHTMKLGEFIAHSHMFGRVKTNAWLRKGFSRVSDQIIAEVAKAPGCKPLMEKSVDALNEAEFKALYTAIQNVKFMAPSTKSVLAIGEESLSKSINRLGKVDFFSVMSRKPTIADFKPVQVEVAIARREERGSEPDDPATVIRFANRVPLQFDKSGCALFQAITSVNWRTYGLAQPKGSLPQGPYVIAISVVSPFIKFKNASKETVDASDELVEEIRRALIQAGQKLSRHIRKEAKEADVEEKLRHIEQFGPILVSTLCRILKAPKKREEAATAGLAKLLGRDAKVAESELQEASKILAAATAKMDAAEAASAKELAEADDPEEAAEVSRKHAETKVQGEPEIVAKKNKKKDGKDAEPELAPVKSARKNGAKTTMAAAEKTAAKSKQASLFGSDELPPPAGKSGAKKSKGKKA